MNEEALEYDALGPIRGWRVWRVRDHWSRNYLSALYKEETWKPGWNQAKCLAGAGRQHSAKAVPWEDCGCGYWALGSRTVEAVTRVGQISSIVVGEVELAGRVLPYELGWRGERARVVKLWAGMGELPGEWPGDIPLLAERMSVPSEPLPEDIIAAFAQLAAFGTQYMQILQLPQVSTTQWSSGTNVFQGSGGPVGVSYTQSRDLAATRFTMTNLDQQAQVTARLVSVNGVTVYHVVLPPRQTVSYVVADTVLVNLGSLRWEVV